MRYRNLEERLIANSVVEPGCECWFWIGKRYGSYGRINLRQEGAHKTLLAHRVAYEVLKGGAIPEGMEVDHTCVNGLCINPDHLELVSSDENIRRRDMRRASK